MTGGINWAPIASGAAAAVALETALVTAVATVWGTWRGTSLRMAREDAATARSLCETLEKRVEALEAALSETLEWNRALQKALSERARRKGGVREAPIPALAGAFGAPETAGDAGTGEHDVSQRT